MTLSFRDGDVSATAVEPPLSQTVGYVVVVVIGLLFAFGMVEAEPLYFTGDKGGRSLTCNNRRDDTRYENLEVDSGRRQHQDRNVCVQRGISSSIPAPLANMPYTSGL